MRVYSKIAVIFVVFSLLFLSCGEEVFRFDTSRSKKAVVERTMDMKVNVTINMPVSETEMGNATIETVNSLQSSSETQLNLKDPKNPGVFVTSEKIISAKYHISQQRDDDDKSFITMNYENGKIEVLDKEGDSEGKFEASAKQSMSSMVAQSNLDALMEIDQHGKIVGIVADDAVKNGIEISLQRTSGMFGVIFPKKGVKVGESWIDKKEVTDIEGLDLSSNPIELIITTVREKDETLNGKKVAVFKSSYSLKKQNVSGTFGGYPVTVDIDDSGTVVNYFDKTLKTFVETVVDSSASVNSVKDAKQQASAESGVVIEIENKTHSVTTEKAD